MHARSGAWRCCDWKRRAARVQCELLLVATFSVLCWTLNLHWNVLLGSSEKSTSRDHWITAFSQISGCYSSQCPSCLTKALRQRAVWKLPSANVCEAGLIAKFQCFWSSRTDGSSSYLLLKIKQFCSSQNRQLLTVNFIMFHLTLIFYPHQMLYTNRSFEICQERMFVKQRRTTAEALTCCRKKYLCSSKNHQISTW